MMATAFSPSRLPECKIWLDMTDRSTLFQDAAGTVPAVNPGDPVGFVRDKSGQDNHARQAVASRRPVLARHPTSGLRQLLVGTHDITTAYWNPGFVTKANAETFYETTANTLHGINQNPGFRYDNLCTLSAEVKGIGRDWIRLQINASPSQYAFFNIQNGTIGTVSNDSTANISQSTDGYWLCELRSNVINANTCIFYSAAFNQAWGDSVGDPTKGYSIRRPQLELGSARSPYQECKTSFDVTETGYGDQWHLKLDGVDDCLVVNPIPWGSDEVTSAFTMNHAVTGVQSVPLMFVDIWPRGFGYVYTAADWLYSRSAGTATRTGGAFPYTYLENKVHVISSRASISAPRVDYYLDGVYQNVNLNNQGTGTYGNVTVCVGSMTGPSQFAKCRMYEVVAANTVFSDSLASRVDKHQAHLAGVNI